MQKIIYLIILLILFVSCKKRYKNYEYSDNGFYYQYLQIGEDDITPKYDDYVIVDLAYKTINDSVFFRGRRKFQLTPPPFPGDVDACFAMLAVGDSVNFIIDANNFFTKTIPSKLPSFIKKGEDMVVSAKLLEIIDKKTYEKQKREFLSWVEDFGEYEKVLLNHYLQGQARSFAPENNGIYKQLIRKGNGIQVENGDTVVVHYEGMFLNGKYFDSTRKRNAPFEFVYGTEWQVVEGLNIAIGEMTEGEKSMFILPSQLAFGQQGSSTGIIPPFTPVIFKVELVQVRKRKL